ncbi:MAG: dTDP-4-amino-4,6-dideoxygalactose transaminase [Nitrospinae bacterium]|nr:dTDP-4-amino-4,6-dideoxygalactose transaminase [Nitrospinota bacterium]
MSAENRIPYNRPFIVGKELEYISQAVMEHRHISGNGPFTKKCQAWLEHNLGCTMALLTHSCTAALEMAAILADIQRGDEVIMPSYTFVSTANAFVLRGGVPVFIDIRPDTLNLDESRIEAALSKKTKAIVPVHYAGIPCAMDEILSIAQQKKIMVIEDAAQAYLSRYKGRSLGTLGHLGCLSFHETKNIISGEGGALLINDEHLIDRAEIVWEKGTDRSRFLKGNVDKYSWQDIGSSYLPSELVSAFLYAQLEMAETIISKRSKLFFYYFETLKDLADRGCIQLPFLQKEASSNGHIFFIVGPDAEQSSRLIQHLKSKNIWAITHYVPLHSSNAGKKYGRVSGDMKVTDDMSQRVIRLPMFYRMQEQEVDRVVQAVREFFS